MRALWLATLLLLLVSVSCGDKGSPSAADMDNDGDGLTPAQGDCNDANAEVRPGSGIVFGSATNVNEKSSAGVTVCRLPQDNDKLVREVVELEVSNNSCNQTLTLQSIVIGPDFDPPAAGIRGTGPGPTTFEPATIPPNTRAVVRVVDDFSLDPRVTAPQPYPWGIARRCGACGSSMFFGGVSGCDSIQIGGGIRLNCGHFLPRVLDVEHSLGTERILIDGCLVLWDCLPVSSDPFCTG